MANRDSRVTMVRLDGIDAGMGLCVDVGIVGIGLVEAKKKQKAADIYTKAA